MANIGNQFLTHYQHTGEWLVSFCRQGVQMVCFNLIQFILNF